uniref:SAM domain-containing protein n=1 Tax=Alexandrium catenella TaxID=2925 RepID=A0A7S1Q9N9_ALECA
MKLNGQRGTVLSVKGSTPADRVPVELEESGQEVSIRPENLELASEDESGSDDSMPPLEHVNRAQSGRPHSQQARRQQGGAGGRRDDGEDLQAEDLVVLVNLKTAELNGEAGRVVRTKPATGPDEKPRLELRMLANDKLLSVKGVNVRRMSAEEGRKVASRYPAASWTEDVDSDDSVPTLRSAARGSLSLVVGDKVMLKGLSRAEYNGQRAEVILDVETIKKDRVAVKLAKSGRVLAVRHDKIEKITEDSDIDDMPPLMRLKKEGKEDPGSDDSMPPLEIIGKPKEVAPSKANTTTGKFRVGQRMFLRTMHKAEYNGQVVQVLPADRSKMLEGQVAVQLESGKRLIVKEKHLTEAPPGSAGADTAGDGAQTAGNDNKNHARKSVEALLQRMQQATRSNDITFIADVISEVELNRGLEWGEAMQKRKKQQLKKLRAKKKKLQQELASKSEAKHGKRSESAWHDVAELEASPPPVIAPRTRAAAAPPVANPVPVRSAQARGLQSGSLAGVDGNTSDVPSDKSWVVLGDEQPRPVAHDDTDGRAQSPGPMLVESRLPAPGASPPAGAAHPSGHRPAAAHTKSEVAKWCEELQLPSDLVDRLEAEDVADPQELAAVADEDLLAFTHGMKIGPKGRFLTAVRKMRES